MGKLKLNHSSKDTRPAGSSPAGGLVSNASNGDGGGGRGGGDQRRSVKGKRHGRGSRGAPGVGAVSDRKPRKTSILPNVCLLEWRVNGQGNLSLIHI